jgi:RND family efflux transporter MFP subunit
MMKQDLLLFCFLLITLSCSRKIPEETNPQEGVPLIQGYVCQKELTKNEIRTYGTIGYLYKADVVPTFGETINDLYFEEGDPVKEGELLALLDFRKLELQMEETKADIDTKHAALLLADQKLNDSRRTMESHFLTIKNAELDLEQKREDLHRIHSILENKKLLFEAGGITEEELLSVELNSREKETALKQSEFSLKMKKIGFREQDLIQEGFKLPEDQDERINLFIELNTRVQTAEAQLARSEWEAALTRIKTLELYMDECRIRAPIDGIIAKKYMNIGEKAQEGQPLYMIYPIDRVLAILQLSEKELLHVKIGQEVRVLSDRDGLEHWGHIHRISPWIQKESRSSEVRVMIDNREAAFKIGQFVRVQIQLSQPEEQIVIPGKALSREDESSVFVIRRNIVFLKKIILGEEAGGKYPVLDGLAEGDHIVMSPPESLMNGMEVRVR